VFCALRSVTDTSNPAASIRSAQALQHPHPGFLYTVKASSATAAVVSPTKSIAANNNDKPGLNFLITVFI
jgi:hypothetical protein